MQPQNYLQSVKIDIFSHEELRQFWVRSQGVWFSKLAKVAISFLDNAELQTVGKIHDLNDSILFGIRLQWEYYTHSKSGQIRWCVDAAHPNLIFPDRSATQAFIDRSTNSDQPPTIHYKLHNSNELIMTVADLEERILLENDNHRLREQRQDGKLIRRLWEHKLNP